MIWRTLLHKKYKIIAKDMLKLELDALADQVTDKDHYVVFTKTQELKYDKDLCDNEKGMLGYSKKNLYTMDKEILKKAKYAHLVKPIGKKNISSDDTIADDQALKLAKKLKSYWIKTAKDIKEFKENIHNYNTVRAGKIRLIPFIHSLHGEDKMVELGYDALITYTDNMVFFTPKSYAIIKTFKLDLPKEEKLDKTLTPEEKKLLEEYVPDLGDHTSFRSSTPIEKLESNVSKMSDDDLAWHLLSSKKAMELGKEKFVRDRFGFREICILQLMNKNITKTERTDLAEYMLDKLGVSFVGGPTLKQYIVSLAKTGALDKNILASGQKDELVDAIYYGKITDPDELRKVNYKEYDYQLCKNPHTPSDVLEKIVEYDKKKSGDHGWSNGEIKWSGMNPEGGGKIGVDTTLHFADAVNHPNYPLDKLLALFEKYKKKYKDNPVAIDGLISTLWRRPDLPKDLANELVAYAKKYTKYISETPPACFDEKEALAYWKSLPKDRKKVFVNHPNTPSEVLWQALKDDNTYPNDRHEAYKKLREKGEITDKDVITTTKKELKFDAPDELLKQFGLQAFLGTKGKDKLKFTKVSSGELQKLQKEMKAATTHDDFTFEVVDAYTVDQQIHKDYPKKAKDIGNIKHGLYHGTSMANAAGILATGINTKGESRTGQMFGNGFYLASSASKAAQYASDNFSKSGYGIVFKMDVALGKMAEWKYGRPEHDDMMYNRDEETHKKIKQYAKKEGFERNYEVPRWHLTHDSVWAKKGLALQHDEYVVKDGQQINITEMIIVHKEDNDVG